MSKFSKIWAGVVISFLVTANLIVILSGKESFPFTQAPMFGHYVGPKTLFYDFSFLTISNTDTTEVYLSPSATQKEPTNYYRTLRRFFTEYGSMEKKSSFGYYKDDSIVDFENRLSTFFSAYFNYINEDVHVYVTEYNRNYTSLKQHYIGVYNPESKRFTALWNKN